MKFFGKTNSYTVFIFIFTFLLIAGSFGSVETALAKKLNGAELKSVISGKSFHYSGKFKGTNRYSANGKFSFKATSGFTGAGKWWMKGNKVCVKIAKSKKKLKCHSWTTRPNGSYRSSSGYILTPR